MCLYLQIFILFFNFSQAHFFTYRAIACAHVTIFFLLAQWDETESV